jgi:hypothetical protein
VSHNFTHVTNAFRPGGGNSCVDQSVDFGITQLFGQIGIKDHDLGKFNIGQIVAIAFLKLLDRVAPLLDHFLKHTEHRNIVEFDALIDLNLLDPSPNQAHHFEPVFFTGLHGGLHVFCDLVF